MDKLVKQSEAEIPTIYGDFLVQAYAKNEGELMPHVVILSKELDVSKPVLLRIHSECMTGDVFGSLKCDCGEQLSLSLTEIYKNHGIIIYLRQEGRGIGLIEKLKAYELQSNGLDTVDANLQLGHQADSRDYADAVDILNHLNITSVNILTNNPEKLNYLTDHNIEVVNRLPIVLPTQEHSEKYFNTKKNRMGHIY